MEKTQPTKGVMAIRVGEKDDSGDAVVGILYRENEFVIYEIASEDVNRVLALLVDGYDDASEKVIVDRLLAVQPKFIEAKALLGGLPNFGLMKNRVAHTLAMALRSDEARGRKEFDTLLRDIRKERTNALCKRLAYIAPSAVMMGVGVWLGCSFEAWPVARGTDNWPSVLRMVAIAASIGGGLSAAVRVKGENLEELNVLWYAVFGAERVILSFLTALIAFILVQAGVLLGPPAGESPWALLLVLVLAAFSEVLIPSILRGLESQAMKTNADTPRR